MRIGVSDTLRHIVSRQPPTGALRFHRLSGARRPDQLDPYQVEDAFEGKGVASVLVKRALGLVRDSGLPRLPVCPFVRTYVQRHPEYLDLVDAGDRARFGLAEDDPA